MTFRLAYGNKWSEAGWRMCDRNECDVITVDGADNQWLKALIVRRGPAFTVLSAAAKYYHERIEPLDRYRQGVGDDWGWSERNDVPDSNHLAGVGMDFNAVQYPWGLLTMPSDRVAKCEQMVRDFEGFLFWGRHWSRKDEMHWQIGVPEFDPDGQPNRALQAFADKLMAGHLGIFGSPDPDAFPLPTNWCYGPLDGPEDWVSGQWSGDRREWRDGLARFQAAAGIPATGIFDADTERIGRGLQVANGWPVTGRIYAGEWNVVVRLGQTPDLSPEPIGMEYADVSQWQAPLNTGYPHPFVMFRVNNGNDVDRNANENLAWAVSMVNDDKEPLRGFGVYTFWRPGEDNFGRLKATVGVPHPRMVVMIDVESAEGSTKGRVSGDQSAGVNKFVADVQAWIGDPKRIHLGYLNVNTNAALWRNRPDSIYYVIPDYSAPKGQPRVTTDGWRIHQYTQTGRCAPWGDAPIDLNYFDGTASEFLTMMGLDQEVVRPPATEPDPLPPGSPRVAFPLPAGYAYGPLEGPAWAVSGRWRDDTEDMRNGLRAYQAKLGVPATGVWETGSETDRATRAVQAARGWPESGYVYAGEWDAVMNGDHPPINPPPAGVGGSESTGVGMTTKVKDLTGPGTTAVQFGVGGTDLGIAIRTPDGKNSFIFGDTFSGMNLTGDWRSPVLLKSDDVTLAQLNAGIKFNGCKGSANHADQLWDYPHNNPNFSTVLPTDALVIGGRTYLHVALNKGLGNVVGTEIATSDDSGHTWPTHNPQAAKPGNYADGYQQSVAWYYDEADDYVYIYGSKFLVGSNVRLWRVRPGQLLDRDLWEPWGFDGSWGWGKPASDILPSGHRVREMCLRKVQNNVVFVYTDVTTNAAIRAKVVPSANGNLHTAPTTTVVTNTAWGTEWISPGNLVAQPYGGYIVPGSTLAELHIVVSQWDTLNGDNWPYRSMQFKHAVAPVVPIV